MTLYSSVELDGDPSKVIRMGFGLVADMVDQLSPEERERQRRATELEERRAATEAEAAAERRAEVEWELARRGLTPRTPLETAAAAHAELDRVDRRAEAAERRLAAEEDRPPRLPSLVDKENRAADDAFMAKPCSIGAVAEMVANAEKRADKKFAALKKWLKG